MGNYLLDIYYIYIYIYIYIHILSLNFFWQHFYFWGCYAWKSLKICPFSKCLNQNLYFWIFSKNSFRNELHALFLPYFNTQHLICKFFNFNTKKLYLNIISIGVCNKTFLIKANKKILYWVSQSALRGGKTIFFFIFFLFS